MAWVTLANDPADIAEVAQDWARSAHSKFLVDENLGPDVARVLRDQGFNVRDVWQEGLDGKSDEAVFQHAWRTRRILLTHDTDFMDDRSFPEHSNAGVVVLPGGHGNDEALGTALAMLVSYIGRMPEIWRKSKIVITANGEITIRCRQEDGRMGIQRYRVRQGVSEIWEDE
ncbi:DUF5615 family PIN-like protein [Mesorhizobium caraganae]|uniref:DUF5615 family PIN-like protein n=1 Tax=Mesorhizobium caraganae TaxID=483206 RepID=A0ABV1YVL5_9HYPH